MWVMALFEFIRERHRIAEHKRTNKPKPWTHDRILQSYRFTNVYREWDKVTQWIVKNWREPHKCDPDLWFAMVVARMFNWPGTLQAIGYPVPFQPECMRKEVKQLSGKVFTGAYMIRCDCQSNGKDKCDYLIDQVFVPMWRERNSLRVKLHGNLQEAYIALLPFYGMGSFMAGQVIADLKYVRPLKNATDWWSWAAMGPGSQRGLNRVLGLDIRQHWKQAEWLARIQELAANIAPLIKKEGLPRLHNQDLQNCLCEFDKYERVRLGEGRPRSLYDGV